MSTLRTLLSSFLLILALCACASRTQPDEPVRLTGFLESATVDIAPEIGGRLVEVAVDEGDSVASGQIVARLDDSHLRLQLPPPMLTSLRRKPNWPNSKPASAPLTLPRPKPKSPTPKPP